MVALVCACICTLAVPVAAQSSPSADGATFSNSNPLPGEEVTVSGTTDALAVTDISTTVDDAPDALAYTGSDADVPIAAGVSLLLAGGVALSFARRRQQA